MLLLQHRSTGDISGLSAMSRAHLPSQYYTYPLCNPAPDPLSADTTWSSLCRYFSYLCSFTISNSSVQSIISCFSVLGDIILPYRLSSKCSREQCSPLIPTECSTCSDHSPFCIPCKFWIGTCVHLPGNKLLEGRAKSDSFSPVSQHLA